MTAAPDSPRTTCATCLGLEAAGVTTQVREISPEGGDQLLGLAAHSNYELRACPHCGRLYGYRHHSEYDVTGSWDEYYYWVWPESCQAIVPALLDHSREPGERDRGFAEALAHEDPQVRLAGSLALASEVASGLTLGAALTAAATALADPEFLVGNFCYRALLAHIQRGPTEAALAREALDRSDADAIAPRFARILRSALEEDGPT